MKRKKFACLSFLSPEEILQKKEIFYFEEFLKNWDFAKSMNKFTQFLGYLSYKYKSLNLEKLTKDFDEFVVSEKNNLYDISLHDEYKTFLEKQEESLEKKFNQLNNFQTSVRGLKIR